MQKQPKAVLWHSVRNVPLVTNINPGVKPNFNEVQFMNQAIDDVLFAHAMAQVFPHIDKQQWLSAYQVRIPAKLNSHSGQREHPDP